MKSIHSFLSNRKLKNASWLIGCRIGQMLIQLGISILLARYLGPANFGVLQYAASLVAFFGSVSTLGLHAVLVKEYIDHPGQPGTVAGTGLVLRFLAGALSAAGCVGLSFFADAGDTQAVWIVALTSLSLILHAFDTLNYWFQAGLRSKITAIAALSGHAMMAIYKVILLMMHADLVWFALAQSVDYLLEAAILLLFFCRDAESRLFFSGAYAVSLLKKSCPFILPALMISLYGQIDKIMLKQMIGEAETGFYATAVTLCGSWTFVLTAILHSCAPAIIEASHSDRSTFEQKNRQLYALIFYLSISVSVLITVLARPLVLLIYGQAYAPAVRPLQILTWYTAFSFLGGARDTWIVCCNRQKYLFWLSGCAAAANIALNYWWIPHFGAAGAAWASLVTQILTVTVIPGMIPAMRPNVRLMWEAVRLKGVFQK